MTPPNPSPPPQPASKNKRSREKSRSILHPRVLRSVMGAIICMHSSSKSI